jgi:hypothetical protein
MDLDCCWELSAQNDLCLKRCQDFDLNVEIKENAENTAQENLHC